MPSNPVGLGATCPAIEAPSAVAASGVPSAARIAPRRGRGPDRVCTRSRRRRPGSRSDGSHDTPTPFPLPDTGRLIVPRSVPNSAVPTHTGTAISPSCSPPSFPTRTQRTPAVRSALRYAAANRVCGYAVRADGVSACHITAQSRRVHPVKNCCAAARRPRSPLATERHTNRPPTTAAPTTSTPSSHTPR